jgi:hypothetical protein
MLKAKPQNEVMAGMVPLRLCNKMCSMPFSRFSWFAGNLWYLACGCVTLMAACVLICHSLLVCVTLCPNFPSYKDTRHIGLGGS